MATLASSVTIPSPASADFVNGEVGVGLSVTPSGGVPYHFTREFNVEKSGLYLIKLYLNGSGEFRIGRGLSTLAPVFVPPVQRTVRTQVFLAKGVNRISIKVTGTQAFMFALLIYHPDEVFYASSGAGWVYQGDGATDVIPDIEVPDDTGAALPVFGVMPNWGNPITERIAYLTDILASETSKEQPRLLRMRPRRTFEAEFLRKGTLRARIDSLLVGIGRRPFWLPLWHEKYRVSAPIGLTTTSTVVPVGTLAVREFQVGDRVLLTQGDPDHHEMLTVASLNYDTDTITWSAAPTEVWPTGTMLIPLRKARIVDQGQFTAPVDTVARGSLRFELVDPEFRFGASWGRCSPVWHFRINRGEDISFTYDRSTFVLDNEVGPVSYKDPGDISLIAMRSSLLLKGRDETVTFRRFIDIAGGRAGRFYMPTRMHDIEPAALTFGGATLDAMPAGFTDYIRGLQNSRSIIAIVPKDGSPNLYRTITDVQRVGGVERFTLDIPLPPLTRAQVERIQFMVPSRFDQDSFEFSHLVDESAAVTTTVVTRSVDGTGMPPIDCYITSPTYPLEVVDAVTTGFALMGARLIDVPMPMDEMSLGLNLVVGVLGDPLQTYNESPEGLDTAFALTSGTLT